MQVLSGQSNKSNAKEAVGEAIQKWQSSQTKGTRPDFLVVFHSTNQNAEDVAAELARVFPGTPMIGCTTAGEHLNGNHFNGSLVLSGIWSPKTRWTVCTIENLSQFTEQAAFKAADTLFENLGLKREQISPEKQFCLMLCDGLSGKEEILCPAMAEALEGISLIGGSAGDDLKFKRTQVIANGKAYDNTAVFALADAGDPFHVIKHQHFIKTPKQVVITKVDQAARRVYEIDGRRAVDAYAAALGILPENFTAEVCFVNPLIFRVNSDLYVRSVGKIEADGTLLFYCAIEEGMVLEIGGHEPMDIALERDLKPLMAEGGKAEFFFASNCILRALEAKAQNKHEIIGSLMNRLSKNIIGFDTYGEQVNGLHINQTLVGLALGRAA